MTTFAEAKQKLIDDWPEDIVERKRRTRELYEILCLECDAEIAQFKSFGMTDDEIYEMAKRRQSESMPKLIAELLKGK